MGDKNIFEKWCVGVTFYLYGRKFGYWVMFVGPKNVQEGFVFVKLYARARNVTMFFLIYEAE